MSDEVEQLERRLGLEGLREALDLLLELDNAPSQEISELRGRFGRVCEQLDEEDRMRLRLLGGRLRRRGDPLPFDAAAIAAHNEAAQEKSN